MDKTSSLFPSHKPSELLANLHPFTQLVWFAVWLISGVVSGHPVLLFVCLLWVFELGIFSIWIRWWKFYVLMSGLMLIINLWVAGGWELSIALYSLNSAMRIILLFTFMLLMQTIIQPDQLMRYLSRYSSKWMITLMLSIRLFPLLQSDLKRIRDVMAVRGVRWEEASRKEKLVLYSLLLKTLLHSSLEGAWETAESMEARGYQGRLKSHYHPWYWKPRDTLLVMAGVLLFTAFWLSPWIGLGYILPVVINRGDKQWPVLRLKI